jgi:hypothetical protein
MYFDRILAELKATSPAGLVAAVDAFDWDAWKADVAGAYQVVYGQVVLEQADLESGARGYDPFRRDDPFVKKFMTGYVAERVTQLEQTTRDDVKALIRGVLDTGGAGSHAELRDQVLAKVRERFEEYAQWRADRIARTETAIAYNHGSTFAYRQAGIEKVQVSDGDDDADCAALDGTIQTLEWALAHPVAHPNCTRSFAPVAE